MHFNSNTQYSRPSGNNTVKENYQPIQSNGQPFNINKNRSDNFNSLIKYNIKNQQYSHTSILAPEKQFNINITVNKLPQMEMPIYLNTKCGRIQ
jgi:hypothetical protein